MRVSASVRRQVGSGQPVATTPLSAELEQAVTALYRQHHAFVWRNARRLGCADDWVDDAVHEVFLVVSRRLAEFEGRSHERTWLFAITYRVVQRLRRDRSRQQAQLQRYGEQRSPGVARTAEQHEEAQYLRYLLTRLPPAQQLVLILVELEGFASTEVAETLGIPAGTVHSRLRAAKQQLARAIEQEREHGERSDS
jgi:RNA polymerase sigma-70 factor (ECF subfamily)